MSTCVKSFLAVTITLLFVTSCKKSHKFNLNEQTLSINSSIRHGDSHVSTWIELEGKGGLFHKDLTLSEGAFFDINGFQTSSFYVYSDLYFIKNQITDDTLNFTYHSSEDIDIQCWMPVMDSLELTNPPEKLHLDSDLTIDWTGSEIKEGEEVLVYLSGFFNVGVTNNRPVDLIAERLDSNTFFFNKDSFEVKRLMSHEYAQLVIERRFAVDENVPELQSFKASSSFLKSYSLDIK